MPAERWVRRISMPWSFTTVKPSVCPRVMSRSAGTPTRPRIFPSTPSQLSFHADTETGEDEVPRMRPCLGGPGAQVLQRVRLQVAPSARPQLNRKASSNTSRQGGMWRKGGNKGRDNLSGWQGRGSVSKKTQ
ncbi:hypothetical protein AGIG_G2147 [Arapaima gigas]